MRLPPSPAGTQREDSLPADPRSAPRGATGHPLVGGWSATRWQYTSRDAPRRTVDLVCDLGGSVTLGLTATAFILAWDIAGRGRRSLGGAWVARDDELRLRPEGTLEADAVRFRLSGETLSLHADDSAWDFDGDGRESSAGFVAVLVRL